MVKNPTLNGVQRLKTQGTLDIGDVPKLALHDSAMPKVIAAISESGKVYFVRRDTGNEREPYKTDDKSSETIPQENNLAGF